MSVGLLGGGGGKRNHHHAVFERGGELLRDGEADAGGRPGDDGYDSAGSRVPRRRTRVHADSGDRVARVGGRCHAVGVDLVVDPA